MAEYLDFINVYMMGVVEMSFQLYFLAKILKKKVWLPFYFLFTVCAVIVNDFVPSGTIIGFVVLVFLLTAYGTFICRVDFKYSLLYAALAMEIMLLCYEIVNSLISLSYPWMPAFFPCKGQYRGCANQRGGVTGSGRLLLLYGVPLFFHRCPVS